MKKLIYISFALIWGCCECLEPSEGEPFEFCESDDKTITEFYPDLESDIEIDQNSDTSLVFITDQRYSKHGFLLPNTKNDERFDLSFGVDRFAIEKEPLPISTSTENLSLAVLTRYPSNDNLVTDFIVTDIDLNPLNPSAKLRFYGRLNYFSDFGIIDDANQFCDFVKNNADEMKSLDLVRYGDGISDGNGVISTNSPLSNVVSIITDNGRKIIEDIDNLNTNRWIRYDGYFYDNENIALNDINNRMVNDGFNVVNMSEAYNNLIDNLTNKNYNLIDIEVNEGEIFVVESFHGIRYAIHFLEFDQIDQSPIRKRVKCQFTRL